MEAQTTSEILSSQQKAYTQCLEQISELIDMRATKEITSEEFKEKKPKLEKEKKRLEELLKDTGDHVDKWLAKAEETFDFARDAVKKFNEGEVEDRRYILSRLGSNLILKDKILSINLDEVLNILKKAAKEANEINDTLEPIEGIDRTSQLQSLYSQNPTMLPSSDVIITSLEKIVKAFEDIVQVDLIRQRWEEIKQLQIYPAI